MDVVGALGSKFLTYVGTIADYVASVLYRSNNFLLGVYLNYSILSSVT